MEVNELTVLPINFGTRYVGVEQGIVEDAEVAYEEAVEMVAGGHEEFGGIKTERVDVCDDCLYVLADGSGARKVAGMENVDTAFGHSKSAPPPVLSDSEFVVAIASFDDGIDHAGAVRQADNAEATERAREVTVRYNERQGSSGKKKH